MIYEMTTQVRVTNFDEGKRFYQILLNREPDFIPHEGFAEWELIPGCWLQVAEGTPSEASGPLRIGVTSIETERARMIEDLDIEFFDIQSREEVPVKWATFSDPWGNRLGFFEYISEEDKNERIDAILKT